MTPFRHPHWPSHRSLTAAAVLAFAAAMLTAPAAPAVPVGRTMRSTPTKVLLIIDENHTASAVAAGMPYLTSMARSFGQNTKAVGVTHPSLPNYLAISAGSTFGITDDKPPSAHRITGESVFGEALAHGRTAHVYADGAPSSCAQVDDPSTSYAVRHTGWPYFVDEHASCQLGDTGLTSLAADISGGRLPNLGWLIPSNQHNAHTPSTLQDADAWLRLWLPLIVAGPDFRSGSLVVVITFDEGSHVSNSIPFIVLHPSLSGVVRSVATNQYGLSASLSRYAGGPALRSAVGSTDALAVFGL